MRISDWSSDVCSSDLAADAAATQVDGKRRQNLDKAGPRIAEHLHQDRGQAALCVRHRAAMGIVRAAQRLVEISLVEELLDLPVDQIIILEDRKSTRLNSSH